MTDLLTPQLALELLRDGYYAGPAGGEDGVKPYFLLFHNPDFEEDNGKNPYLLYKFPDTEYI